jgi:hypothetical protein
VMRGRHRGVVRRIALFRSGTCTQWGNPVINECGFVLDSPPATP